MDMSPTFVIASISVKLFGKLLHQLLRDLGQRQPLRHPTEHGRVNLPLPA